ncbi:hypothetical protein QBC34DRAFT_360992 [Podospora aff. communis PSN243]|uniref:DNA (cytosine-5-)-methyltransferase n=1 Tax=Podospora aff. communis PSN243 TaxID=3040156 RepID=A0AAV9G868_9PEZI|nr:hypothetical protein QBC34DRAFT_360992 [Podospora aff. communis PSN243]
MGSDCACDGLGDSSLSDTSEPCDHNGTDLYPLTRSLGLSTNYVPCWTCADAFREFYQNWKDGMVASFSLNPRDPQSFAPKWNETKDRIEITVRRGGSSDGQLLGFIRLDKKSGRLELANFNARLELKHLDVGGTSKRGESGGGKLAGTHGEGFKIAALVMRRNGYGVRISASSYYWNFSLRGVYKDMLHCKLSKPAASTLDKENIGKAEEELMVTQRTKLNSYIAHDVLVRISPASGVDRCKISAHDFRAWAAVALDLDGPSRPRDLIQTTAGDLILDPKFAGTLYLKGLRVGDGRPAGGVYEFAYNFAEGYINRDREFLPHRNEAAKTVAHIWAESMVKGGEAIVRHYIRLFQDHPESLDIYSSPRFVSRETACLIWEQLLKDSRKSDVFYYSEGDGASQSNVSLDDQRHQEIIETSLKKKSKKIDAALWKVLRWYKLVRTPDEERRSIFQRSEEITVDGNFAKNVLRVLRAAFQLHDIVVSICVVSGGDSAGIDLLCEGGGGTGLPLRLLIHKNWFSFTKAHEGSDCDLSNFSGLDGEGDQMSGPVDGFYCDHVVFDLFEMAIRETRVSLQLDHQQIAAIRRKVFTAVRQMPRRVKVSTSEKETELVVTWAPDEIAKIAAGGGLNIRYHIRLHKASSCLERREDLIYTEFVENLYDAEDVSKQDCGCPAQTVGPDGYNGVVFKRLDPEESYFPMVARAGGKALFTTPPIPISAEQEVWWRENLGSPTRAASSSNLPRVVRVNSGSSNSTCAYSDAAMLDSPDTPFDRAHSPVFESDSAPVQMYEDYVLESGMDEDEWREWFGQEASKRISQLFSASEQAKKHGKCEQGPSPFFPDSELTCDRLGFDFEEGSFVDVRLKDPTVASGRPYVLFIHGIHLGDDGDSGCSFPGPHLSVTRYTHSSGNVSTVLDDNFPGSPAVAGLMENSETPLDLMEFFLHYIKPERMGTRDDAELVAVDDILAVTPVPPDFDILHCVHPPAPPEAKGKGFCRFACSVTDRRAVFTPLAHQALPRLEVRKRHKRGGFATGAVPYLVDVSPSVLGASEGFLDEGYEFLAGVGFDGQKHHTWRVRNPTCQVFDGDVKSVVDEIGRGELPCPIPEAPGQPLVASLASKYTAFRLRDGNTAMPSLEDFLQPFNDMISLVSCPSLTFHFTALQMPVAVLRNDDDDASCDALFDYMNQFLVKLGHSVSLQVLSLSEYGLPQDRQVVVVTTSLYPGMNLVDLDTDERNETAPVDENLCYGLEDLSIDNTRPRYQESNGSNSLAMCSVGNKVYYNHGTGRKPRNINECIVVDATGNPPGAIRLFHSASRPHVHQVRGDLLTVRELARLQGFDDDFIFYGSPEAQYREVLAAQPPMVSQMIGRMLRRVIELNTSRHGARITGAASGIQSVSGRPNKRARVEEADEEG